MTKPASVPLHLGPQRAAWWAWSIGTAFFVYSVFDAVVFAVFYKEIRQTLELSAESLSVLSAVFFVTFAVAQLFAGVWFDRFSARSGVAVPAAVSGVGCIVFALASNAFWAGVGRVVMGAGLAFAFVGAVFLSREWFAPRRYATMVGLAQFSANVVSAALAVLLAFLAGDFGYRPVFVWTGVVGLLIAAAAFFFVGNREGRGGGTSERLPHAPKLSVAETWGLVLGNGQVWLSSVYFGLSFGTLLAFADLWNIPNQGAYGNSLQTATMLNAMIPLGVAVGSVSAGVLSSRTGRTSLLARIYVACALVMICLLIFVPPMTHVLAGGCHLVLGVGLGGSVLGITNAGGHADPRAQGTAIGFVTTTGYLGGAALQPVIGSGLGTVAVSGAMRDAAPDLAAVAVFSAALQALPIALVLALALSLLMRDPKPRAED